MLHFLRHWLYPHETNNHRPKILHHNFLSFLLVFLLGLSFSIPSLSRNFPSVLGANSNISIQTLLDLTNQKRAENGLSPLSLNSQLSLAAEKKAANMFTLNYWAHIAPDGTTPWYFIKSSGYEYVYAGENLARGFDSADAVVNAWMQSPTHRENILSANYNDIGFAVSSGVLTGSDTTIVVQEFGTRYAQKVESPSSPSTQITTPTIIPTTSPTSTPAAALQNNKSDEPPKVAASQSKPLINTKSTTRNFSIYLLILIICVLVVDAIVIERKKIQRVVSHNLDHVIFLGILLVAAIIAGKGAIL